MKGKPKQILWKTGMKALAKAKELGPDATLSLLEQKKLMGRGGAAFLTAGKWKRSKDAPADEKFVICNADEGEPGTFKDRFILMRNAETMIEGILIAAYVVGAKRCFIYLRGEYEYLLPKLQRQVNAVLAKANNGVTIEIVLGAGAYICGEQTALIQSIMGFRGHATYRPPNPTLCGLWGKPTVINNVETLTCAAQAILYDEWDCNLRLFSLSGNVEKPGVYELPIGVKMSGIIKIARPKNKLKAMSFGCFGGIMPVNPEMAVTPDAICAHNCQHGAFSIILIDEKQNVVDVSQSIARFYTYESCGKCTPCREGNVRVLNLINKVREGKAVEADLTTLRELAQHINETSLCGLGQSSGNHVLTSLQHFKADYEAYMKKGKG